MLERWKVYNLASSKEEEKITLKSFVLWCFSGLSPTSPQTRVLRFKAVSLLLLNFFSFAVELVHGYLLLGVTYIVITLTD